MSDFLRQHLPRLYRFALRLCHDVHIAEDITQEAFLRAWSRRSALRDDRAARVWLFRIAHNLWRDRLRRERVRRETDGEAPLLAIADSVRPGAGEQSESARRVLDAMAGLPDRQREVLHLVACEDLSIREISAVLEISPGAVKASLSLARTRVRELLSESSARVVSDE